MSQSIEPREPAFVDPEIAEKLLFNSIKIIVEEEGLRRDIYDPVIESLALTAFHDAVQECTAARYCVSEQRLTTTRYNEVLRTYSPIDDRCSPNRAYRYRF